MVGADIVKESISLSEPDDRSLISSPWLKSTTLVKPSHRRLPNRCLSELLCLS